TARVSSHTTFASTNTPCTKTSYTSPSTTTPSRASHPTMNLPNNLTLTITILLNDTSNIRIIDRDTTEANLRAATADVDVAWESAPRVGARARLAVAPGASATVVATVAGAPFFVLTPHGAVLAADLDDPSNAALRRWGYLP